jgi:hypothetical protein
MQEEENLSSKNIKDGEDFGKDSKVTFNEATYDPNIVKKECCKLLKTNKIWMIRDFDYKFNYQYILTTFRDVAV